MKKKIAITLDENILKKITVLANEDGRNISNQINKILKDFLEEKGK